MKTTLPVNTFSGKSRHQPAPLQRSRSLYLVGILCLATPLTSIAAMVYGNVTNCTGAIEISTGNQRVTVPIQANGTFQVVVPPGIYQARCTGNNRSLAIRSDANPLKQDLRF
jgi:hypothetical protein